LTDPPVCRTDGQTDRQTDGIAMAYTRCSIYAVARKNTKRNFVQEQLIVAEEYNLMLGMSFDD